MTVVKADGRAQATAPAETRAVAGVHVSVVNSADGTIEKDPRSDSAGNFSICIGRAGAYFVVLTMPGYAEASFPLRVDQSDSSLQPLRFNEETLPPSKVALERGPQVRSGERQVETEEPTLRSAFTPHLTETLPIPGFRTFDSLALLAPGVLPPPETNGRPGPSVSPGIGSAGQFAVNGLRSRDNNFDIDGSDNNDEEVGARRQGFVNLVPQAVESVKEFQAITALGDSRFGRSVGGQINVLTKSGARNTHGQLYDFFNDLRLNARDFFDNFAPGSSSNGPPSPGALLDGQPIDPIAPPNRRAAQLRSQWGGFAGGPLLPGRESTYFFTSFEQKILNASENDYFAVPTPSQRGFQGSGLPMLQAPGASYFAASVPGDAIFSLFPFPNDPAGPYGSNTFAATLPASGDGDVFSAQIDRYQGTNVHKHTLNHTLTVRYNGTVEKSILPVTGGAIFSSLRPRLATQNVALLFNTNFSEHRANSFRASYGRTSAHFDEIRSSYLSPSYYYPGTPFLLNAPLLLNTSSAENPAAVPTFVSASSVPGQQLLLGQGLPAGTQTTEQITGPLGEVEIAGFSPLGVDTFHFPQKNAHKTREVADTFTYVHGSHVLTAGVDNRDIALNSSIERGARPYALFGGLGVTGVPGGGPNAPSGFLSPTTLAAAGVPSGLFQTLAEVPNFSFFPTRSQTDLFLQDEIRATNTLRFDIGFRLELNMLPSDIPRQRLQGFNPTLLVPVDFQTIFGHDRVGNDPRVGFAWDVGGKGTTAIRGGFAVYTGQFPMIVLDESQSNIPYFLPMNFANFPSLVDQPVSHPGGRYLINFANPYLFGFITPGSLSILNLANPSVNFLDEISVRALNPGFDVTQPAPEIKNPYSYQYALTVGHELFSGTVFDTVLSVGYVGTQGRKLLRVSTPNQGFDRAAIQIAGLVGSQFPDFLGTLTAAQGTTPTRPFPTAQELWEGTGTSSYNSLQVEVRRRYSNHLEYGSAFTYSQTLDDTSDFFDTAGEFALAQDSVQRSERGAASFDAPLRSVSYFVFDVPFWKGKRVLGGWQLSGIYTAQSGQPFTVNTVFDINEDGNLTDRLNTSQGLRVGSVPGSKETRITVLPGTNLESLLATKGTDGSVGRNTFRARGINDLDFSLAKTFRVTENHRIQARVEIFNALNRTHFGIPERILESPAFGKSVNTTVPPRTIQFAVKYSF